MHFILFFSKINKQKMFLNSTNTNNIINTSVHFFPDKTIILLFPKYRHGTLKKNLNFSDCVRFLYVRTTYDLHCWFLLGKIKVSGIPISTRNVHKQHRRFSLQYFGRLWRQYGSYGRKQWDIGIWKNY